MQKRILVVYSERHIARLLQVHLERAGYAVVLACMGREMRHRFAEQPFDLIIVESPLPNVGGIETVKHIYSDSPMRSVPTLFLLDRTQHIAACGGWNKNGVFALHPPFTAGDLLTLIYRILQRESNKAQESNDMARFGGMGGFGDMQKLMKQAQKMQEDAAKLQDELITARFQAQAGGGMVTAIVNGHGHLVELKINPVVADPDDVEMLEDLIITATKEATEKAQSDQQARMDAITGDLKDLPLPPGLI